MTSVVKIPIQQQVLRAYKNVYGNSSVSRCTASKVNRAVLKVNALNLNFLSFNIFSPICYLISLLNNMQIT